MFLLNKKLIVENKVSLKQQKKLHKLYSKLSKLLDKANNIDNISMEEGHKFAKKMKKLEFKLQKNWNFQQNELYHTWWNKFEKCMCPKIDNMERFGQEKIINNNCPFHGNNNGNEKNNTNKLTNIKFKLSFDNVNEIDKLNLIAIYEKIKNKSSEKTFEPVFNLIKNGFLEIDIKYSTNSGQLYLKKLISDIADLSMTTKFKAVLNIIIKNNEINREIFIYFDNGVNKNSFVEDKNILIFDENFYNNLIKKSSKINKSLLNGNMFYSENEPVEIKGYKLIEVGHGVYKYVKIQKEILYKNKHRTHYLKWGISDDISIRYFYVFEDDKSKEGKFFIKSHNKKHYNEIDKKMADILINEYNSLGIEIIGFKHNDDYKKIIIDDENINIDKD